MGTTRTPDDVAATENGDPFNRADHPYAITGATPTLGSIAAIAGFLRSRGLSVNLTMITRVAGQVLRLQWSVDPVGYGPATANARYYEIEEGVLSGITAIDPTGRALDADGEIMDSNR